MDLDAIQSALKDFATFGGNIGKALQLIPSVLGDVVGFFTDFKELSTTTDGLLENLSSVDGAGNGGEEGSALTSGSSKETKGA